jgi:hypothetical protein
MGFPPDRQHEILFHFAFHLFWDKKNRRALKPGNLPNGKPIVEVEYFQPKRPGIIESLLLGGDSQHPFFASLCDYETVVVCQPMHGRAFRLTSDTECNVGTSQTQPQNGRMRQIFRSHNG